MSKCLVTTLKESVTDANLLKLGEIKLHVDTNSPTKAYFHPTTSKSITVTVLPPGYITNENGTANLGQTITISTTNSFFVLSSGEYDIIIDSKYDVGNLSCSSTVNDGYKSIYIDFDDMTGMNSLSRMRMNSDELYGDATNLLKLPSLTDLIIPLSNASIGNISDNITGSISDVENKDNVFNFDISGNHNIKGNLSVFTNARLNNLNLRNTQVEGNLASLVNSTGIRGLDISFSKVTGSIANLSAMSAIATYFADDTNIDGDVSNLPSSLTKLSVSNANVTGALSSFTRMTNLSWLNISGTNIVGDTSQLASLTNLTTFRYTNCPNITGTWPLT